MVVNRRSMTTRAISLVPLIDVFMILLVFFLVTSTYLNLDALPAVDAATEQSSPTEQSVAAQGIPSALVLRLRNDGSIVLRGTEYASEELSQALDGWRLQRPDGTVIVIPSGAARMQDLAATLDGLRAAQIKRVRLVSLGAAE